MKFLLLCMWTWVLLVLMRSGRSKGCLDEERDALLKIKAAFNHPNGSALSDWGEGDMDCCGWDSVVCDNATSRVTQLDLSYTRDRELPRPWVIDASLFLPLEELQELDLIYNSLSDINGTLHLKKLKRLDLSSNYLQMVPSLYKQTSVEDQNLSSNQLEGVNLEELNLLGNNLVTDALTDIANMTSLKTLDISFCDLNAAKSLEGLCRLRKLEGLYIDYNELWGPLPSCFSNLTSLRGLDVSYNNFSGAIPSSLVPNLKSLESIDFSGNAFQGSLSLASLANNSKLEIFDLHDNRNRLEVNTEEPTWFPSFQLNYIHLSDCILKDAYGVIPSFLKEQHDLEVVVLSHSGMKGNFPNWLLVNNSNLEVLVLRGNNLLGSLHWPANLSRGDMLNFDVSANAIDGELPSWIGYVLPKLTNLNFSNNLLEGRIPSSMGNMEDLEALDLSYNDFTGDIPEPLAKNCTELSILILSGNNLQGEMLPRNSNLPYLQYLYLDSNRFKGEISPGILNSSLLQVLDVSNNSLSGTLPDWIGDFQSLSVLMLSSNLFGGPLPLSFCNLHNLMMLDLSSINLGPNLLCVNVTVMRFLHLSHGKLNGHFPEFLSGASSMITLDLRHNALSGEVPNWIASLRNLKVLLLQGNNFKGSIPQGLCLLKNMTILDLSNNYLSGKIPPCLKDLTFENDGASTDISSTFTFHLTFSLYRPSSPPMIESKEVNFMTKNRLESYKGHILGLMSGMDLSRNNLTGSIPLEVGHLRGLRALNLSHNHLTGPIPETLSNLKNVESLDLSYNSLTGPIPPQLTELYTLSDFNVAHNNLSGRTPERKNQFGTFDEASYEGNPLLCGSPLTSCDDSNQEHGTPPSISHTQMDDVWREAFLWSFAGSYVVAFLGVVLFLYLSPYYQWLMFDLVRKLIPSFPHQRLFF